MEKKLYRSESDRMVGGVCGGLAEYFSIDSTIVRLIFVLIVVYGGTGLILYIILWIVIPTESIVGPISKEDKKEKVSIKKVKSDSKK